MSTTTETRFARKCSITGVGMNEGWMVDGDTQYAATKEAAEVLARQLGFKSLRSATWGDEPTMFWTEWNVADEIQSMGEYYTATGELVTVPLPCSG
jgi:hypothetical protein